MNRDLKLLGETRFDVLVIGAGIYGATVAWDAALRGLSVALIDRGDFGAATSFNSAKTIHGGIRSLQRGNLPDMREFIRERRALSRIAPHLVHPLPFLVPTYADLMRGRAVMGAAMAVYNLVAYDRNALDDPSKHLAEGRVISREECLGLYPGLDPRGVTGGALWYDCQMYSSDRLTMSFVLSAARQGAVLANYVEAASLTRERDRLLSVRARDRVGNQDFDIRARVVVNAAGPWATRVLQTLNGHLRPAIPKQLSLAMNVVTRQFAKTYALGGLAHSRFMFVVPWREYSVFGTSHEPYRENPDGVSVTVTRSRVERILADLNTAFPSAKLTLSDVRLVHRGLLPATSSKGTHVALLKQSQVRDHRADGIPGLLTVLGVRYTTARHTAAKAVDRVCRLLGHSAPCRTATTPLVGGDIPRFPHFLEEATSRSGQSLPRDTRRRLAYLYGTEHRLILNQMAREPSLAAPLGVDCPITHAELIHAIRHEMAMRLSDALLRRTEAGTAGHPGSDTIRTAAAVMGRELGWSEVRMDGEIGEVERLYRIEDD